MTAVPDGLRAPAWEDVAVSIEEKIEAALRERLGHPMSIAELVAAIPDGARAESWDACTRLRAQGRLGRNGLTHLRARIDFA